MSLPADRPPSPGAAASVDDLVAVLLELRDWGGNPSYAEITRRVGRAREQRGVPGRPGRITVYDCFRTGRRRLDGGLVLDIVEAFGVAEADREVWRRALRHVGAVGGGWAHRVLPRPDSIPMPGTVLVGRNDEAEKLAALPRDSWRS